MIIDWRLYARNPVCLPGFIPRDAPPKVRHLIHTIHDVELAKLGNPGPLTRTIMVIGWGFVTAAACLTNFSRHRRAIRKDMPALGDLMHLRRLLVSAFGSNIAPGEFYQMKFYQRERYAERQYYLLRWQGLTLMTHALPAFQSKRLADKLQFWRALSAAGIPVVPILGCVHKGQWTEGHEQSVIQPGCSLVIKPTDHSLGAGIQFFDAMPNGHWQVNGQSLNADGVRNHIEASSRTKRIIVQPLLTNHPATAGFGTLGLVTIRIVTMKTRAMATPVVFDAVLRIPGASQRKASGLGQPGRQLQPAAPSDALVCPIDLATGTLGPAAGAAPGAENLMVHPVTQTPLAGHPLPFWEACKAACLRAHQLEPTLNSVGWDVVLTPDGPLMLEANLRWGVRVVQLCRRFPLLRSAFVDLYEVATNNVNQAPAA